MKDVSSAPRRQAAMPFIMLTVLIDMVSIGLIVPVIPLMVGPFVASPGEQAIWFGAMSFAYGVANFIGSPILGALSDRYGRRPVLLIGFFGLALSFFVTAMATALWMLIAVRLVSGALQANAAVANAYVADITPPELRAKRFGMIGAMFGLGFILGPVMGGLLGAHDLHLPFYVAGSLAVLNAVYGFFVLPESLPAERRRQVDWSRANPISSLRGLGRLQGIGPLVAVIGLAGLAQFTMHTAWVLYGQMRFGWGPRENGWSLFAVGVMSVVVQGGLLGLLLKRFSPQRLAVLGLTSSALAYVGWGLATAGWVIYAIVFINVLGFAAQASMQSIVSNAADARQQGQAMGAVGSLNSLMAVLGPVFGPALLSVAAHYPRDDWRLGAPYYFCALLMACAAFLASRHFRRQRALGGVAADAAATVPLR